MYILLLLMLEVAVKSPVGFASTGFIEFKRIYLLESEPIAIIALNHLVLAVLVKIYCKSFRPDAYVIHSPPRFVVCIFGGSP